MKTATNCVHVHKGNETVHFPSVEGSPKNAAEFISGICFPGASKIITEEKKGSGILFRYSDRASAFVFSKEAK